MFTSTTRRGRATFRIFAVLQTLLLMGALVAVAPVSVAAAGNMALQLSTSSYVTMGAPGPAKLGLTEFTIETWFKRTGTGTSNTTGSGGITIVPLVTHGAPQNEKLEYRRQLDPGDQYNGQRHRGRLRGDRRSVSDRSNAPVSGMTAITNDVWHHAAATFDGTTFAVYLDGNLENSITPGFHPRWDSTQGVGLGTMITTNDFGGMPSYLGRFDGVLDEVRVWDDARSLTEIQDNKDLELTSGTGLIARWGFDEGTGNTVGDSMPTPANGDISGTEDTDYSWVAGFEPPAPNTAPDAPTLNSPTDGATGVGTSPTLDVRVSDPDVNALTVTYYGRPYASGNFSQIAQHTGVTTTGDTATWNGLGEGQEFEWYVTVSDGIATTTGDTWTFHTIPSTDTVFVGAGDIADCGRTQDTATGNVLGGIDGTVWTTGDNVYPAGMGTNYPDCYGATPWGAAPQLTRTRAVPGNHDWGTGQTPPGTGNETLADYFAYFGPNSQGSLGESYYSYDIDTQWHAVVLDSECQLVPGGCAAGSAQELWLRGDSKITAPRT